MDYLPKQAERIIKFYNEMNTQAEVDNQKMFEVKQTEAMADLKKSLDQLIQKDWIKLKNLQ